MLLLSQQRGNHAIDPFNSCTPQILRRRYQLPLASSLLSLSPSSFTVMLLVVVVILSHLRWFGTHQATKPIDPRRCSSPFSLSLSLPPLSLAILNSSIFQIVAVIRSQNHSARLPATFFTAVRRWLSDVAAAGSAHRGGLTSPHCAMA